MQPLARRHPFGGTRAGKGGDAFVMSPFKLDRFTYRRGTTAIMLTGVIVIVAAFATLGVDWGRVQTAKTELQQAADAACRAAVCSLPNGVTAAQNAAVAFAAKNTVAGAAVTLDPNNDLEFGLWDPDDRSFQTLTGSNRAYANAIRVTLTMTGAKGNALPLTFGQVLGMSSCNLQAQVIATYSGGYGVVGLNSISLSGNSSDSYWAPSGYASSASQHGSIASNGNITLGGSTSVQGDAHPGIGKSVSGASHVSGSTTPLTYTLYYPNADASPYQYVNDNAQCSAIGYANDFNINGNHSATMPAGNYYVHNLSMGNNSDLWVTGPASIYVTGSVNISGTIHTAANRPSNLTIYMCSSNPFSMGNNNAAYVNLYAPQSAVTLSGSGDLYGQVIGLTVSMSGSSAIHYDQSLPSGQAIATVK